MYAILLIKLKYVHSASFTFPLWQQFQCKKKKKWVVFTIFPTTRKPLLLKKLIPESKRVHSSPKTGFPLTNYIYIYIFIFIYGSCKRCVM